MISKLSSFKFLPLVAVALISVLVSAGCSGGPKMIEVPRVTAKTEADRRNALELLEKTWEERPLGDTEAFELAERRFVRRVFYFYAQTENTESFRPAARLADRCYREYKSKWGDNPS